MLTFYQLSEKLKKDKDDPCWKGYAQLGTKKKNGKEVPNCVPKEGITFDTGGPASGGDEVMRQLLKGLKKSGKRPDLVKDLEARLNRNKKTTKEGTDFSVHRAKKAQAPSEKDRQKMAKVAALLAKEKKPKKENVDLKEKSVSKAQQRFMGMVRAKQKGEMPDASPEIAKAAASMSKKDVKDFAKTKHKGLPSKVNEEQVDELNKSTLQSYRKKAVDDVASGKKTDKRAKGVQRATNKIYKKEFDDLYRKEESEIAETKVSVTEGPDYLGDIRRKKEREERKKSSQHAGETQRQKTMRKAYGNYMGGLKKGYGESVELGEGRGEALKAFEALVKRGGIDRATFQKAYDLYKATKFNELKKLISDADTDVSEAIADLIQRHDSKAFNSMYPKAKSGDYLRNITRESAELDVEELNEEKVIKIVADTNSRKYKEGEVIKTFPETKAGLSKAMVFQKSVKNKYGVETTMVRESVDGLQEAASPFDKAAAQLEKTAKDAKFKRFYGQEDADDLMSIATDLKSSNSASHKMAAAAARNLDTIVRDIVFDAVDKHAPKEASKMFYSAAGMKRMRESVSHDDKTKTFTELRESLRK